jgi:phosphatidate cytidylyltransferase
MKTRAITALFFVIIMVGSFCGGAAVFVVFYSLLALACLYEFYGLFDTQLPIANRWVGLLGGFFILTILALTHFQIIPEHWLWSLFLLSPFIFYSQLASTTKHPFNALALLFLGWIYALAPFIAFIQLGFLGETFEIFVPLGFLLILWTSDTGAYLTGKAIGRHKLFERISPKKTWEGFVGGILLAQLTAYLWANYTPAHDHLLWSVVALMVAVGGTYGDLVESMLKRSLNKKDSGQLLPGHGGLLDRFDGLLLAAPLVYVALRLIV